MSILTDKIEVDAYVLYEAMWAIERLLKIDSSYIDTRMSDDLVFPAFSQITSKVNEHKKGNNG